MHMHEHICAIIIVYKYNKIINKITYNFNNSNLQVKIIWYFIWFIWCFGKPQGIKRMANFNGKVLHMIKTNEQASVESIKTSRLDQWAHGPGQRLPLGREKGARREERMEAMSGLPEYSYPFTQTTHAAERTNAKCHSVVYNKYTVVLRAESAMLHFSTFSAKEQRRHHDRKGS